MDRVVKARCCAFVVLGMALLPLRTQAAPAVRPPGAELVQRLGDPSFEVREAAAAALARLGPGAAAALQAGLTDPDAEVRRRCAVLLPLARRSDQDRQLDEFLADTTGKRSPPGWPSFRKLAGEDRDARRLFVRLYRSDRSLVELLQKDPKKVSSQLAERCQRLQWNRVGLPPRRGGPPTPPEAAIGLLVAAALAPPQDVSIFYRLCNACYHPEVRALAQSSVAAQRLLSRALRPHAADPGTLSQAVNVAVSLNLVQLRQEVLEPAVQKAIETTAADDWRFYNAVYQASRLGMHGLLATRARPAIRRMVQTAASGSGDFNRLMQAVNLVQLLQMQDDLEAVLRPAILEMLRRIGERPEDMGRIYQARYLANVLNLNDAFDRLVLPGVCCRVVELAAGAKDVTQLQQAQQLAMFLNLDAAFEGVLRPAGQRLILADLAGGDDLTRLARDALMAGQLRLDQLRERTLKPLLRRHAVALREGPPDAGRIQQVFQTAQALAMQEAINDHVKPAFRRLCRTMRDRTMDSITLQTILALGRSLEPQEAVTLALQGAFAKTLSAWERGAAILFVGEFGTKEQVAQLEGLLKDTTSCGVSGISATNINTQLRDVALAALVFRSGQSLAEYGFPLFEMIPAANPFQNGSGLLGFASAADREAAQKKWQSSAAARKKG